MKYRSRLYFTWILLGIPALVAADCDSARKLSQISANPSIAVTIGPVEKRGTRLRVSNFHRLVSGGTSDSDGYSGVFILDLPDKTQVVLPLGQADLVPRRVYAGFGTNLTFEFNRDGHDYRIDMRGMRRTDGQVDKIEVLSRSKNVHVVFQNVPIQ